MRRRTLSTAQHEELGALLREVRLTARLTQVQLAAKFDRKQSFVAKIEAGERKLEVLEFCEYVSLLGANPIEVLAQSLGINPYVERESS